MFDRFRAASPARQIQLIAIGVILIGGILAISWYFFLRTPYMPLFTNLRATDAATIVASLEQKKIPYHLADGGTTILVPAEAVDVARLNATTDDLPLKGTVGFELFNKSDMGLTDFAQKINYQRALQGELARTIMTLDGVDTARVHLSLGEDRIFRDDRVPPKASVTIRMQKGASLTGNVAQGVKRLIAAAVSNLDAANVVILDETGREVGSTQDSPSANLAAIAPLADQAPKSDIDQNANALPLVQIPDDDHVWLFEAGFAAVLFALILTGFILLLRRLGGPRRLTEQQREDLVAKLRSALQQRDNHVTSPG